MTDYITKKDKKESQYITKKDKEETKWITKKSKTNPARPHGGWTN